MPVTLAVAPLNIFDTPTVTAPAIFAVPMLNIRLPASDIVEVEVLVKVPPPNCNAPVLAVTEIVLVLVPPPLKETVPALIVVVPELTKSSAMVMVGFEAEILNCPAL